MSPVITAASVSGPQAEQLANFFRFFESCNCCAFLHRVVVLLLMELRFRNILQRACLSGIPRCLFRYSKSGVILEHGNIWWAGEAQVFIPTATASVIQRRFLRRPDLPQSFLINLYSCFAEPSWMSSLSVARRTAIVLNKTTAFTFFLSFFFLFG